MNFEHSKFSREKAEQAHYFARLAVEVATDGMHVEWLKDAVCGAMRRMTDSTASCFVGGTVGKHRNNRWWTQAALSLVAAGQDLTRKLHGEHAIEARMLAGYFIEAVRGGLAVEKAPDWWRSTSHWSR